MRINRRKRSFRFDDAFEGDQAGQSICSRVIFVIMESAVHGKILLYISVFIVHSHCFILIIHLWFIIPCMKTTKKW